jgi:hypothetical protein
MPLLLPDGLASRLGETNPDEGVGLDEEVFEKRLRNKENPAF